MANRAGEMKRLALVLGLIVWLLLAVVVWRSEDLPARADEPAPVLSGNSLQIEPGRYVMIGVVLYDKQTGQEVVVYNGSSFATAAPTPAPPTAPPLATHTPEPPPASLTPTPESGLTPSPTSSVTKACLATSSVSLNLRADHTTNATIIDNVDPSVRMEVLSIWIIQDVTDEWLQVRTLTRSGQVRTGWVFRGTSVYFGVDDTLDLCWDVPVAGPGANVPTPAPTATPVPGPSPTPVPTEPAPTDCTYRHTYAMTIRDGWSTSSRRIGTLPANVPVPVGHLYPNTTTEQWAFITYAGQTGWVAVRTGGVTYGSLLGDCSRVRRDPVSAAPMVGWTVVPGASRDALLQAGAIFQAAGITPTATVTSDHETATVLHDNGWFVVVRLWTVFPGDCPDMSLAPAISARLRVEYLARQHSGARFNAAQLSNECGWPSAAYLRDWLIAAVGECDARGWQCIPTVFNTGAPELDWLPVLRPALRLMRDHGHLLGYNAYPYDAQRLLCEVSDYTSYTTYRWRRFSDVVPASELPPIYLTEAARGDGARAPALEDAACFAAEVAGEVIGICYWYTGTPLVPWQMATWSHDQLMAGARAIVRALSS